MTTAWVLIVFLHYGQAAFTAEFYRSEEHTSELQSH